MYREKPSLGSALAGFFVSGLNYQPDKFFTY